MHYLHLLFTSTELRRLCSELWTPKHELKQFYLFQLLSKMWEPCYILHHNSYQSQVIVLYNMNIYQPQTLQLHINKKNILTFSACLTRLEDMTRSKPQDCDSSGDSGRYPVSGICKRKYFRTRNFYNLPPTQGPDPACTSDSPLCHLSPSQGARTNLHQLDYGILCTLTRSSRSARWRMFSRRFLFPAKTNVSGSGLGSSSIIRATKCKQTFILMSEKDWRPGLVWLGWNHTTAQRKRMSPSIWLQLSVETPNYI